MDDLGNVIERMLEALGAGPYPIKHIEEALRQVAAEAARIGASQALLSLRSTQQVADELGITTRMVQAHALRHDIGRKVAPGQYVFRPEDIEALRAHMGKPGRPRKSEAADG